MAPEIAPRIVIDPEIRFGKPIIKGTRVPVVFSSGPLGLAVTRALVVGVCLLIDSRTRLPQS